MNLCMQPHAGESDHAMMPDIDGLHTAGLDDEQHIQSYIVLVGMEAFAAYLHKPI